MNIEMKENTSKSKFYVIDEIIKRAEKMELANPTDRMTSFIDLDFCIRKVNLDIYGLLQADDFNFVHDFCGIRNNIDRKRKTLGDFLPRYARFAEE